MAGFHFDSSRSNDTHQVYEALGSHISIYDYNDQTKVDLCLAEGCEYTFNLVLEVSQGSRTLAIDVSYAGGIRLNDNIVINEVTVFYDGIKVHNSLVNPVEVKGPTSIVIPLND